MTRAFAFTVILLVAICGPSFCDEWKIIEGHHFLIYYMRDEQFAREALRKAEGYYQTITADLGFERYGGYWTWENRAKIYIYPDHKTYSSKTLKPKWSHGAADAYKREMVSYEAGRFFFMQEILPHELTHLIFRDFVPFRKNSPMWLEEGIANWEEVKKRKMRKKLMMRFYKNDLLFPLKDLVKTDVRMVGRVDNLYIRDMRAKDGGPSVAIFSTESFVNAFYVQSASLVGFMIEDLRPYNFGEFCRAMSSGKKVDDALRAAYSYIHDLDDLERRWRDYLGEQYQQSQAADK